MRLGRLLRTCSLSIVGLGGAAAQPAKFEAATVRHAPPSAMTALRGGPGTSNPGQINYTGVPLRVLLTRVWGLTSQTLSGPPAMNSERYDIVAKVPPGTTRAQLNPMLQKLLVERLALVFHNETKDFPVYELVVAKGGRKLPDAAPAPSAEEPPSPEPSLTLTGGGADPIYLHRDKNGSIQLPPGRKQDVLIPMAGHLRLMARMQTMPDIVRILGSQADRPMVVDKTGLTGTYDFVLEFLRDSSPRPAAAGGAPEEPQLSTPFPNLYDAVVQQLGLKLEPRRAPMPVMVVDSFSREPVEK